MFTDMSGVWKLLSLDFSLLGFIVARFEKLVELQSNYPTLFLKVDDNLNIQKMSLCRCFCFTDIFDLIMFPQSYQSLQPGLITFIGAEICFPLFLRGAHCFGLKALLIWLTLIIILGIFSSRKQLFVMNPAQLTVAVQDFTAQNQGNKRKSIYIAEFKNSKFIPITSCVVLYLSATHKVIRAVPWGDFGCLTFAFSACWQRYVVQLFRSWQMETENVWRMPRVQLDGDWQTRLHAAMRIMFNQLHPKTRCV